MLHFWVGYLHPFVDGNSRLARVLFYWYLLKNGYWGFAYLPISTIIKKSPVQYKMAYVYSEQDDNDLTYFIDYSIRKIERAAKELEEYINKKSYENKNIHSKTQSLYRLNARQVQLLQYLQEDDGGSTTPTIHKNINQISKVTAIKDLQRLVELDFLTTRKEGKNRYYLLTKEGSDLFKKNPR